MSDNYFYSTQTRAKSTSVRVTTGPATAAILRKDVLDHLRMDEILEENNLIDLLTLSVIGDIEATYDMALITQTITETFDKFPCGSDILPLRIAPFVSVSSITYKDSTGTTQTWDSAQYLSGTYSGRGFVLPKTDYEYPTDLQIRPDAVTVIYVAGFGDTPATTPKPVVIGALLSIADLYANPTNPVRSLPQLSERFLQHYYPWNK